MQKVGEYLLFLVIGAIIGVSISIYVSNNQTPSMGEQVKVTIQGIEYIVSDHSALEIVLLNNVPAKNLKGNVTVYQDEKQWTSEVTWYYTGYGEAEVICDSINETQNFRLTYIEDNPKVTYLDRIIEWKEVGRTYPFVETEQLIFPKIDFVNSGSAINMTVRNTGTVDVTITLATVTGYNRTGSSLTSKTIEKAKTEIISITLTGNWVAGKSYNIEILSSKGNKFSYTATA
jgi:hypothetical protein